ncbi:uncharacterized protein LOC101848406 [Aplysia californica]|uniref:Uncharacterized protein LOC101848406 n=1 Tax=Aplysia californica TaxID=6500 RepID=A0ABM1A9D7_APLCA|nr:uncharacterized protein LOC101848406 [Aplysia californica]
MDISNNPPFGLNLENRNDESENDESDKAEGGFDTKRTFSELDSDSECFNDEGILVATNDEYDPKNMEGDTAAEDHDPIFEEIKDAIARRQSQSKSSSSNRSVTSDDTPQVRISDQYVSIPYGIQPRASYEHGKRSSDIMGVTYNGRMRQFIILDSKGITTWKRDAVKNRVERALQYPKYEYRLITYMLYAKKFNCYFALGKDFSLKVYNRDFCETCSVSADLRSVLFMLFNPVRDELITGGVGGTKVWRFHQQVGKSIVELKPLANYGLTLKYELPNVGGSWVKRVELDHDLEHLYCCSDTDLHVYNLTGKLLFKFERAHMMSITGCRYSKSASVLVTSSIDCEVKVWSLMGGLVHTFRGHSRAVTNLILHPATPSIVITCSLDGTVRMWSLDTMDTLYSLVVSVDGVLWMGLTDDNMLFMSTPRALTLWNLNYSMQFWALARSSVTRMKLCGSRDKTTRLMAVSEDSSIRLMARSNCKNLSTVLPPPSISPLQRVLSVCYSREFNVIYMLINPHEIWLYTSRTDPCCRMAVWDVIDIQDTFLEQRHGTNMMGEEMGTTTSSWNKPSPSHRATENGVGNEVLSNCCCITVLNSTAMVWTDEGCCCPIRDSYLLLGLEDGRILFMDPVIKGHKYLEFKTGKDPVLDMCHDTEHNGLITLYKLKDRMQIHVWGLPDLELQHEIYVSPDLRDYARVGYILVTGHESGSVIFNTLEHATDPGLHKAKMLPPYHEVIDTHHKPEHQAPIITVDVCTTLKIFCSCSDDGAIKIWSDDNVLMTEIMLDTSLTSACFLNTMGDLLVGFQKHIFYMDHTKVCSQLTVTEAEMESFDKESFICEDPAVLYEGVTPNPDPVNLQNYLVPFDIEFSKDFLEGRVKLEPEVVKKEESDEESEVSMAPTEIYYSPDSTPRRRLSLVDLTLGSEVSKYDLLKHMKKTLDHLAEKERREAAELALQQKQAMQRATPAHKRRMRRQMRKLGFDDEDLGQTYDRAQKEGQDEGVEKDEEVEKFSFPQFGESPGSTPRSTPPSTPEILSGDEEPETDVTQETVDVAVKVEIKVKENDEISKFLEAEQAKAKQQEKTETPRGGQPKRTKFGLGSFTVDADSLIKSAKKSPRVVKRATASVPSHAQKGTDSDSDSGEKKPSRKERQVKKKAMISSQKRVGPKQRKPEGKGVEKVEEPPTQMQALTMKEQTLDVPDSKVKEKSETDEIDGEGGEKRDWETVSRGDDHLDGKEGKATGLSMPKVRDAMSPTPLDQSLAKDLPMVPGLPTVPPAQEGSGASGRPAVPSAAESKAALIKKLGNRSAMDFHSSTRMPGEATSGAGDVGLPDSEPPASDGASQSGTGVPGRGSATSMGSEESRTAFRIGLLSMEKTVTGEELTGADGINKSSTPSDMWAGQASGKSPPPDAASTDISISRPASQMLSDFSAQPPSISTEPRFEREESIEPRFGSDAFRQEMDASETGAASMDSGWVDSDFVSVSRQGVRPSTQQGEQLEGLDIGHGDGADGRKSGGLLTEAEVNEAKARPMTSLEQSFSDQPEMQNALKYFRQRPRTAQMKFETELELIMELPHSHKDLQQAFDSSLVNYRRLASSNLASDQLYRNDDMAFSENWHERQIERHMLIRMQKELRSQNAQKRRQLMEMRKQEKWAQHVQAVRTHDPRPTPARASTVHGSRPSNMFPAPTPESSRPHTATGIYRHSQPLITASPQQQQLYALQHQGQQLPGQGPMTMRQQMQQLLEARTRQQEVENNLRGKALLGSEKPFRCRIRPQESPHDGEMESGADQPPSIDPWLLDPRNPRAVRPKSSKSIPSKCHRYVLVTKPKTKLHIPLPTPLEEHLLATRFPDQGEKVFRRYEGLLYHPPRRPAYGIDYSPYQHQLYG